MSHCKNDDFGVLEDWDETNLSTAGQSWEEDGWIRDDASDSVAVASSKMATKRGQLRDTIDRIEPGSSWHCYDCKTENPWLDLECTGCQRVRRPDLPSRPHANPSKMDEKHSDRKDSKDHKDTKDTKDTKDAKPAQPSKTWTCPWCTCDNPLELRHCQACESACPTELCTSASSAIGVRKPIPTVNPCLPPPLSADEWTEWKSKRLATPPLPPPPLALTDACLWTLDGMSKSARWALMIDSQQFHALPEQRPWLRRFDEQWITTVNVIRLGRTGFVTFLRSGLPTCPSVLLSIIVDYLTHWDAITPSSRMNLLGMANATYDYWSQLPLSAFRISPSGSLLHVLAAHPPPNTDGYCWTHMHLIWMVWDIDFGVASIDCRFTRLDESLDYAEHYCTRVAPNWDAHADLDGQFPSDLTQSDAVIKLLRGLIPNHRTPRPEPTHCALNHVAGALQYGSIHPEKTAAAIQWMQAVVRHRWVVTTLDCLVKMDRHERMMPLVEYLITEKQVEWLSLFLSCLAVQPQEWRASRFGDVRRAGLLARAAATCDIRIIRAIRCSFLFDWRSGQRPLSSVHDSAIRTVIETWNLSPHHVGEADDAVYELLACIDVSRPPAKSSSILHAFVSKWRLYGHVPEMTRLGLLIAQLLIEVGHVPMAHVDPSSRYAAALWPKDQPSYPMTAVGEYLWAMTPANLPSPSSLSASSSLISSSTSSTSHPHSLQPVLADLKQSAQHHTNEPLCYNFCTTAGCRAWGYIFASPMSLHCFSCTKPLTLASADVLAQTIIRRCTICRNGFEQVSTLNRQKLCPICGNSTVLLHESTERTLIQQRLRAQIKVGSKDSAALAPVQPPASRAAAAAASTTSASAPASIATTRQSSTKSTVTKGPMLWVQAYCPACHEFSRPTYPSDSPRPQTFRCVKCNWILILETPDNQAIFHDALVQPVISVKSESPSVSTSGHVDYDHVICTVCTFVNTVRVINPYLAKPAPCQMCGSPLPTQLIHPSSSTTATFIRPPPASVRELSAALLRAESQPSSFAAAAIRPPPASVRELSSALLRAESQPSSSTAAAIRPPPASVHELSAALLRAESQPSSSAASAATSLPSSSDTGSVLISNKGKSNVVPKSTVVRGSCPYGGCKHHLSDVALVWPCMGCRKMLYCSRDCRRFDFADSHRFQCQSTVTNSIISAATTTTNMMSTSAPLSRPPRLAPQSTVTNSIISAASLNVFSLPVVTASTNMMSTSTSPSRPTRLAPPPQILPPSSSSSTSNTTFKH